MEHTSSEPSLIRVTGDPGAGSEWVARVLGELRHGVVVADPNFEPMYAARTRKVKADGGSPHCWPRLAGQR